MEFPPFITSFVYYFAMQSDCSKKSNSLRHMAAFLYRCRHGAESAFSVVELIERRVQVRGVKIGPHALQEHKFRIGALPQQKIRKAFFAAGANEQVHCAAFRVQDRTKP